MISVILHGQNIAICVGSQWGMCGEGDFAPFLSSCYYRVKKYLDSVEKWGLEYIRRMKRAEDK